MYISLPLCLVSPRPNPVPAESKNAAIMPHEIKVFVAREPTGARRAGARGGGGETHCAGVGTMDPHAALDMYAVRKHDTSCITGVKMSHAWNR